MADIKDTPEQHTARMNHLYTTLKIYFNDGDLTTANNRAKLYSYDPNGNYRGQSGTVHKYNKITIYGMNNN